MKKVKEPQITIERILTDDKGHITALDIHDENFGEAVFLEAKGRHYHGFYKPKSKTKSTK